VAERYDIHPGDEIHREPAGEVIRGVPQRPQSPPEPWTAERFLRSGLKLKILCLPHHAIVVDGADCHIPSP